MKVIIAGGRNFDDAVEFEKGISEALRSIPCISVVVSGCAPGADTMGEAWAARHGIPVHRFTAEWDKYGASAGPRRNRRMALYADALIAFWDGESRGTQDMIDQAKEVEGLHSPGEGVSACVCGKSGSKLDWNECGQCGGTGQNVYEKYLHFFAVNARVQCPQLTCQQAEEVYALLLHMDERSGHYANELGKALSENLNLKEQLEKTLASLERALEQCPKCERYGPFDWANKAHTQLKCPHCLFDWAVTAPATKP